MITFPYQGVKSLDIDLDYWDEEYEYSFKYSKKDGWEYDEGPTDTYSEEE